MKLQTQRHLLEGLLSSTPVYIIGVLLELIRHHVHVRPTNMKKQINLKLM